MKRSFLWLLFVLISVSSCTIYKEYPIDVYKPGEIAIPSTAKNVAIVYRNFKYKNDTLQHYYKDDNRLIKANGDPDNLDSTMVSFCVQELAQNLKDKNLFDRINIYPDLFKQHSGNKLPALSKAGFQNNQLRSRSEFPTTNKLLVAISPAAMTGLMRPKLANGTATRL